MKYSVDGKLVSKEEALSHLNQHFISTEAEWIGETLVIKTLKIKLGDVCAVDCWAERKAGIR